MKQKDMEYLRDCFIRVLIDGDGPLPEDQLIRWNRELNMSFEETAWFCVVMRLTGEPENGDCGERLVDLKNQIQTLIRKEKWKGTCIIGNAMDVVMLLHYCQNSYQDVLKIIEKWLAHCRRHNIRIGIGRPYKKMSQFRFSKEEACEALGYGKGQTPVMYIADIAENERTTLLDWKADRQKILEQFMRGETNELQTELNALAEQVRAKTVVQPDAPYPTSIRRTMIELLVEMLHIASDAGVDVDAQIDYVDPYRKVFEMQSTPAIIQWITEVAQVLYDAMEARQKRLEQSQLEQVKAYIQEHLADMELSLATASGSVGMSPNYFSAFFIREAGVGFKEYVTAERIKLAQALLKNSNGSINAISEQCGFLSPSYFISVFKSHTGMTPGAYRKLKN